MNENINMFSTMQVFSLADKEGPSNESTWNAACDILTWQM